VLWAKPSLESGKNLVLILLVTRPPDRMNTFLALLQTHQRRPSTDSQARGANTVRLAGIHEAAIVDSTHRTGSLSHHRDSMSKPGVDKFIFQTSFKFINLPAVSSVSSQSTVNLALNSHSHFLANVQFSPAKVFLLQQCLSMPVHQSLAMPVRKIPSALYPKPL
jgi:hypothetical protein